MKRICVGDFVECIKHKSWAYKQRGYVQKCVLTQGTVWYSLTLGAWFTGKELSLLSQATESTLRNAQKEIEKEYEDD